jgi:hypothetical protein
MITDFTLDYTLSEQDLLLYRNHQDNFLDCKRLDVKGSYGMLPNNNHEKKSRNDG